MQRNHKEANEVIMTDLLQNAPCSLARSSAGTAGFRLAMPEFPPPKGLSKIPDHSLLPQCEQSRVTM